MKKLAIILLGIGLVLTSCQHKELEMNSYALGSGNVSITVYASDAIGVRSADFINSALGGATNLANVSDYSLRYKIAVYDEDGLLVDSQTSVVSTGGTNFTSSLNEGETYTIVAWADFVTDATGETDLHYDTTDLTAITYASGDDAYLNDESRDAYYAVSTYTGGSAVSLTLYRPFAKLRLVATDWENAVNKPYSVKVSYSKDRYTYFNAETEAATTEMSNGSYTGDIDPDEAYYSGGYDGSDYNYRTLYMDYILVDSGETDITLSYTTYDENDAELHSYDINQTVPLVRNCLTTVIGKLLSATSDNDIKVSIDDDFDTKYEVKVGTITVPDGTPTYTAADGHTYPAVYVDGTLELTASTSDIVTTKAEEAWTWESDNTELAKFEDSTVGTLTGVAVGGPVVVSATQTDESGIITDYANLTVYVIAEGGSGSGEETEGGVAFDNATMNLPIDASAYTLAVNEPDGASQTLTWASSNTDVVTVADGVLTATGFGSADITVTSGASTLAEGYTQSATITVTVAQGYYDEEFTSETTNWALNSTQSSSWVWSSDGYYTITTTAGRGDFGHRTTSSGNYGDNVSFDVYLDPAAYPIVCFRMDDLNDGDYTCNITLDTSGGTLVNGGTDKYSGGVGGNNNQWSHKYACSDGSAIIAYDLTEKKFTKTDGDSGETSSEVLPSAAHFTTFQFKYADIKDSGSATPASVSYRFFWFKTFTASDFASYISGLTSDGTITEQIK